MKNVIAHIRQLCCLGLGGEAVMPALLRELHDLVACDSGAFFWVDETGEMSNLYAERLLPPELMRLYFSRFYDGESSFRADFARRAGAGEAVAITGFSDEFFRSDYYNLIWRPLHAHQALYAVIREHGRALGQLSLYRGRGDRPFDAADRDRLASVVRYIAHALSKGPPDEWEAGMGTETGAPDENSGLVVVDRRGAVVHSSREARRLLFLAGHPRISPRSVNTESTELPAALRKLCTDLDRIFRGESAPPPVARIATPWGAFVCRAYALGGASDGLVGIMLHHRVPLPLALLAAMKARKLSVKQKEVVLLLARGDAHPHIARQLNVSLNTVNYHVRQIYTKLDAHDRVGMIDRLLGRQPSFTH